VRESSATGSKLVRNPGTFDRGDNAALHACHAHDSEVPHDVIVDVRTQRDDGVESVATNTIHNELVGAGRAAWASSSMASGAGGKCYPSRRRARGVPGGESRNP
jgi:hypothetical protein